MFSAQRCHVQVIMLTDSTGVSCQSTGTSCRQHILLSPYTYLDRCICMLCWNQTDHRSDNTPINCVALFELCSMWLVHMIAVNKLLCDLPFISVQSRYLASTLFSLVMCAMGDILGQVLLSAVDVIPV